MDDFLEDYSDQLESSAEVTWKGSVSAINQEVKAHSKKISAKCSKSVLP